MINIVKKYEVIASGSSGNAVLIDDVLVDVGLSFQKIKPYLSEVNYLIITHTHSDHVNTKTLQRIRKIYPRITVIGNHEVAQLHDVDIIANDLYKIEVRDYTFIPIEVPHDVLTYAYTWETKRGSRVLYCTDTYDMSNITNGLPGYKYDYLFIESNHDEQKLEQIQGSSYKRYGYDAYSGAKRHLSTQQSKTFFYLNRKDKSSEWIELHKSSRFY